MHRGQLFHFLVALAPDWDLLISAKDLFIAAMVDAALFAQTV
jgi:hypothetical protein